MGAAKKKKILVITGTRAEYGLLRSTMDAIIKHPKLELRLLVTGMHTLDAYGRTEKEIVRDGYSLAAVVPIDVEDDMLSALAKEITGIRTYCLKERPDAVLILGDRPEAFAGATVAAHLNIPIAHIHGGDVTGPGVDETLRHAMTKMAHVHFPGTKNAARRIRAMGEETWRVIEAGSVVFDQLLLEKPKKRTALAGELSLDAKRPWLTVLQHPTAFDGAPLTRQIQETLKTLKKFPEHEKIILFPNNDTGSDLFLAEIKKCTGERYHLFPSLPRISYVSLLKESDALIGNSSSGILEISHLGTPAVDIGNRQKGRERGANVIRAAYEANSIERAIRKAQTLKKRQGGKPFPSPYGKGRAGAAIAATLARMLSRRDLLLKLPPFTRG